MFRRATLIALLAGLMVAAGCRVTITRTDTGEVLYQGNPIR